MPRLVSTQTKENYGFKIINYFLDESGVMQTESTTIFEGDTVNDFKFIKNGVLTTVSGKIKKINYFFKPATRVLSSEDDAIQRDAVVVSIVLDHSTKNNSSVDIIKADNILEYNTSKSIEKVSVVPVITVDFKSVLSDESTSETTFFNGQFLYNVTYISNKKDITGDFKVSNFTYSVDEYGKSKLNGLVLTSDETGIKVVVPFENIKSCGNEGIVVETSEEVSEALEKAMSDPSVGGVVIKAIEYDSDINATASINITGNKMNIAANSGNRCSDETLSNETVLKGKLTCTTDADVKIVGVTFTEGSEIRVNGAKSVSFKNCRFVGAVPTGTKSYYVISNDTENPVVYKFENCYFGSNPEDSGKKMYNLFELNSKIASGSYIKNCYFNKDACVHNIINIYDVEEGAIIDIEGNVFELSMNAIRVGVKGNKEATINVSNNRYDATDPNVEYAGLVLVQPYGTSTESFENITINLNNTINNSGVDQLIYLYCGSGDTQITANTQPIVYINKKLVSLL